MTAMATPAHRVWVAAARMREAADAVADASVWSMGAEETRATLVELTTLKVQVAALELRVAAHAEQVDPNDPAAGWAHTTRQTTRSVRGQVKLAQALEAHPPTADALATGRVNLDQARVIVHAIDDLPDQIGPELEVRAEEHLLGLAADHHADALRILGKRLLEVIAPEEADAHEARLLDAEERDAMTACRLRARFDDHGRLVGSFVLPHLQGAMFLKAVMAFAAPQHHSATDGAGAAARALDRPTPQRMGRAWCELIERLPARPAPPDRRGQRHRRGHHRPRTLTGQLQQAGVILDTGHRISPAEARRLACQAGLIPAVLNTRGQVLDLGRKTRLYTEAQRIAIMIRDQHCTEPGCDAPAWMCHVHHDLAWAAGGPTDIANGRLLCPRHHHQHHHHQHHRSQTGTTYQPRT